MPGQAERPQGLCLMPSRSSLSKGSAPPWGPGCSQATALGTELTNLPSALVTSKEKGHMKPEETPTFRRSSGSLKPRGYLTSSPPSSEGPSPCHTYKQCQ